MWIYLWDTPLVTSGGGGGWSTSDFINWLKAQPWSLYSTTKKCMHNWWTTPGPWYIYLFDPYRCTDVLTLNWQIVAWNTASSYSSNVLITFNCWDVFCATCECDCISIYYKC